MTRLTVASIDRSRGDYTLVCLPYANRKTFECGVVHDTMVSEFVNPEIEALKIKSISNLRRRNI